MNQEKQVLDEYHLQRELDRTKSAVFMGKTAAFLGSLMCSLKFQWDENVPTACTNGKYIKWNPTWFLSLPADTRKTVLIHELWHVARLHMFRRGTRDPETWNHACDIIINNNLENEGYSFIDVEWACKDQSVGDMVEEDIYDYLIKNNITPPPSPFGSLNDLEGSDDPADQQEVLHNIGQAIQQAKNAGQHTTIPNSVHEIMGKFLAPIIDWHIKLQRFFNALSSSATTWARPNRRYTDMYMPSRGMDESRLADIAYYFDVSGSVSNDQVRVFNSEVKYIKDTFNPEKLTLIQFDTGIRKIDVIRDIDDFNLIEVHGRGCTDLTCVRDHIIETNPSCVIIFSDLYCNPMKPLPKDVPIIWVALDTTVTTVPFGEIINITSDTL